MRRRASPALTAVGSQGPQSRAVSAVSTRRVSGFTFRTRLPHSVPADDDERNATPRAGRLQQALLDPAAQRIDCFSEIRDPR